MLVSRFARSPPLSVARVACFREGLGHSLGYSPTWRAFQCPRIKQLCMAGISEASPAEERRQRIRAAAQLWQGADMERQAASEMEIKCTLERRPELPSLGSFVCEKGARSRTGSPRAASTRSCGVESSALLGTVFFVKRSLGGMDGFAHFDGESSSTSSRSKMSRMPTCCE